MPSNIVVRKIERPWMLFMRAVQLIGLINC